MEMTELDLLAHTAYAVLLLSFLMRDILWLRVFSVASISLIIPFYYLQPEPLWPCIAWNSTFMAVNPLLDYAPPDRTAACALPARAAGGFTTRRSAP